MGDALRRGSRSREILARDDWISLWWAQDGWFWSKPVLNFWIQSIAMATLGTHYQPDRMLLDSNGLPTLHPEWVVRTPNILMTLAAMYLLYKGVARVFGRRTGLICGLVLATTPDWYYLARQTMTDMPCVAGLTAAMGLLLLGINTTDDSVLARVYEVKAGKRISFRLSGWHLAFGFVLMVALPQIVYLFSRNLELPPRRERTARLPTALGRVLERQQGELRSPGKRELYAAESGSDPQERRSSPRRIRAEHDAFLRRLRTGWLQGILWSVLIGFALWLNWGERRVKRLLYIGAWTCAAVGTMAKGPEGVGIPAIAALAWIGSKKRWSELLRLEILTGVIVWIALVFPWFVAMYVRHGAQFTDRLIFHDMFNRAVHHVHDTNEGDDTSIRFYLWQLGYALFPWTGAGAPLGASPPLATSRRQEGSREGGRLGAPLHVVRRFLAFALVTFMGTKFHHYESFRAVPAAAMLIGIALSELLEEVEPKPTRAPTLYLVGTLAGILLLVAGVARMLPGSIFGTKELHGGPPPASLGLGVFMAVVGLGMLVLFVRFFRAREGRFGAGRGGDPSARARSGDGRGFAARRRASPRSRRT